jgi:hypothetical protein
VLLEKNRAKSFGTLPNGAQNPGTVGADEDPPYTGWDWPNSGAKGCSETWPDGLS